MCARTEAAGQTKPRRRRPNPGGGALAEERARGPKAVQDLIAKDIGLGGKLTLSTEGVVGLGDYALETGKWVATSPDSKHLDHGPYVTQGGVPPKKP